MINKAKKAGFEVIESDVSLKESARLAKQMQLETKFRGLCSNGTKNGYKHGNK